MNNTTITLDSKSNTVDHPYFDMTDPDHWDAMENLYGKVLTESQLVKNKQLLFPVSKNCLPVATITRRKFWKFCGNVDYEMLPMSNGAIIMAMNFTPKRQKQYNVEQLLNEVRHIRDQGLDFSGMSFPNPTTGEVDYVPDLMSQISITKCSCCEDKIIRLTFFPEGTTINGRRMQGDGEYDLTAKDGPVRTGELIEATK
jgi:hypothetical protein